MNKNIKTGMAVALLGITPALALSSCASTNEDTNDAMEITIGNTNVFTCSAQPIVTTIDETKSQYVAGVEYTFTLPKCKISKTSVGEWSAKAVLTLECNGYSKSYDLIGTVVVNGLNADIVLKTTYMVHECGVDHYDWDIDYNKQGFLLPFASPGLHPITKLEIFYDGKRVLKDNTKYNGKIDTQLIALDNPAASIGWWNDGKADHNEPKVNSVTSEIVNFACFWLLNSNIDGCNNDNFYNYFDLDVSFKDKDTDTEAAFTYDSVSFTNNVYNYISLSHEILIYNFNGTSVPSDKDYRLDVKITKKDDPSYVYFDTSKDKNSKFTLHYLQDEE